jgi:hypothetical protein
MCVGSKGANPIKRLSPERIDGILADYSKNKITFALVSTCSHACMFLCSVLTRVVLVVKAAGTTCRFQQHSGSFQCALVIVLLQYTIHADAACGQESCHQVVIRSLKQANCWKLHAGFWCV